MGFGGTRSQCGDNPIQKPLCGESLQIAPTRCSTRRMHEHESCRSANSVVCCSFPLKDKHNQTTNKQAKRGEVSENTQRKPNSIVYPRGFQCRGKRIRTRFGDHFYSNSPSKSRKNGLDLTQQARALAPSSKPKDTTTKKPASPCQVASSAAIAPSRWPPHPAGAAPAPGRRCGWSGAPPSPRAREWA